MADPGFMIPLNANDFNFDVATQGRQLCTAQAEAITQAPWWTNQNIQLTAGGVVATNATVGTAYVIQVGVQGVHGNEAGDAAAAIQNVQAWVCYPNTLPPGQATARLVVPSMQNNAFASFTDMAANPPLVFGGGPYQDTANSAFKWISLSDWTPTQDDFLGQAGHEGHCCIIANAAGLSEAEEEGGTFIGDPVGVVITDNNQLQTDIDLCQSLYQGQRNIAIVQAPVTQIRRGLTFLSGAPAREMQSRTAVGVTAIDQAGRIDPVLITALSGGAYAGLALKPAASPPRSLRLTRHENQGNRWLGKIVREAEEIVEELLGPSIHPFGGGHRLHLHLPPQGLQPLSVAIELEPGEAPGTVHAIDIIQTDANGARGGIRVGVVVMP